MDQTYVPLLVPRDAEWNALARIADDATSVLPLIAIPPFPTWRKEPPTTAGWIQEVAEKAGFHWPGRPVLVDAHDHAGGIPRPEDAGPERLYRQVAGWSRAVGIVPVPVLAVGDAEETIASARHMARSVGAGVAVRLDRCDVIPMVHDRGRRLRARLEHLLRAVDLPARDADLVVDLGQLAPGSRPGACAATLGALLPLLTGRREWRRLVLAGTSSPQTVDGRFDAPPPKEPLPRLEWHVWREVRELDLPRPPDFGDYGGFAAALPSKGFPKHPVLRYSTLDGRQLIVRRRAAAPGLQGFADVCRDVMGTPHYLGPDFSWGDLQIQDIALRRVRPGNARAWRAISLDHHVHTVLRQLRTGQPRRPRSDSRRLAAVQPAGVDPP